MQASEIGTSAAGEGPPTFKKLAKSSAIEISLQVLTLGSYEVFPDNACLVVKPGSYYFSFSVPALLDMNFSFELSLEDVKSLEVSHSLCSAPCAMLPADAMSALS